MELPQKIVDRLLQSLGPVLAEEFDRAVQEALQGQEEAFKTRLETAVREAEQAALTAASSRQEQAIEEARAEVRSQMTEEFQSRSGDAIKQAEVQFEAERAGLQDEIRRLRAYVEAQRNLADSRSQTEMLARFLTMAEPFAGAAAVYVMRGEGLALWKTRGAGAFPSVVSGNTTDPEAYFKPIVVRGRTVAAFCAYAPYTQEALDFLTESLSRAIEAFGMRLQAAVPRVPVGS
jgi:hypothetical protein